MKRNEDMAYDDECYNNCVWNGYGFILFVYELSFQGNFGMV